MSARLHPEAAREREAVIHWLDHWAETPARNEYGAGWNMCAFNAAREIERGDHVAAVRISASGVPLTRVGPSHVYKGASRNLQRRNQVQRPQPEAGDASDMIASAGNMSFKECAEEMRRLRGERARAENELIAAKAGGRRDEARALGHRIQGLAYRLSTFKIRQHELSTAANNDSFRAAAKEILPPDVLRRIYARSNAIQEEMLAS